MGHGCFYWICSCSHSLRIFSFFAIKLTHSTALYVNAKLLLTAINLVYKTAVKEPALCRFLFFVFMPYRRENLQKLPSNSIRFRALKKGYFDSILRIQTKSRRRQYEPINKKKTIIFQYTKNPLISHNCFLWYFNKPKIYLYLFGWLKNNKHIKSSVYVCMYTYTYACLHTNMRKGFHMVKLWSVY